MSDMLAKLQIGGVHLTWQMAVAAIVGAQFAVVALVGVIAPFRMRRAIVASTAIFALGWLVAFDVKSLLATTQNATQASAVPTSKRAGSCASIQNDMTASQVRSRLGDPDETRNEEIVRGPGSTVLVYRDMRCAVHLLDDKVELVD